jgi:hypothetical protein
MLIVNSKTLACSTGGVWRRTAEDTGNIVSGPAPQISKAAAVPDPTWLLRHLDPSVHRRQAMLRS